MDNNLQIRYRLTSIVFDEEVERLCEYADIVEDALAHAIKGHDSWLQERWSELSEEERYDHDEYLSYRRQLFREIFPQTFRRSVFVMCYSLLEFELDGICDFYWKPEDGSCWDRITRKIESVSFLRKRAKSGGRSSRDRKTRKITESVGFLRKHAKKGVTSSRKSTLWQEVLVYSALRNRIVHNNGLLPGRWLQKRKDVKRVIDEHSSLVGLSEQEYIQLARGLHAAFLDAAKQFLKELHKTLS